MRYKLVPQTKEERDINACEGCCFNRRNDSIFCSRVPITFDKGENCYDFKDKHVVVVYKIINPQLSNNIHIL